jgi:hypothetical protein
MAALSADESGRFMDLRDQEGAIKIHYLSHPKEIKISVRNYGYRRRRLLCAISMCALV